MPPQPRQRTKLTGHPAKPADQGESGAASRGRAVPVRPDAGSGGAGAGRPGTGRQGDGRAGSGNRGAGTGSTGSGTAGASASGSGPAGAPTRAGQRIAWTQDAKTMRAQLTAWSAARRKAAARAEEVRALVAEGRVPVADATAIVERVAADTGETVGEVARAAGLNPADFAS